jgi:hypothetical protein
MNLLIVFPMAAAGFYRDSLLMRPDGWAADHLRTRRFERVLKGSRWNVGYAPDAWSQLVEYLRSQDSRIRRWWLPALLSSLATATSLIGSATGSCFLRSTISVTRWDSSVGVGAGR